MKGNEKLLTVLNQLLADELTAISQYMVHSEMCDSWGYDKLHKAIEGQARDEMHHAEAIKPRVTCCFRSSRWKRATRTGRRCSAPRSSRWVCRTTWPTRLLARQVS